MAVIINDEFVEQLGVDFLWNIISEYSNDKGTLTIKFEMPAIIMAEDDNKEVCLRITTSCEGIIEIPNADTYEWDTLNFADMMLPEILEYTYMTKVISVSYEYIEADVSKVDAHSAK